MGNAYNREHGLMTPVDAVVLAGGRNSAEMQAATGVENRALVRLGERTMLEYVIKALIGAPSLGRIFVVGDVPESEDYERLVPGQTMVDNLFAGLRASEAVEAGDRPVLAVTSDIPFLTPAAVQDFVARAVAGADFCYPIIPIATCQARFPEMRRTTLKIREGTFTGGNLMLLQPRALQMHRETILRAYAARKRPLQLGGMLGWGLLARIALAQTVSPRFVSLAQLETGVSRVLGCRAAAVVTEFAEIGTDVDKPDDVTAAHTRLAALPSMVTEQG